VDLCGAWICAERKSKEILAHVGDIGAIQQIMRDDHLKTLAEMGVAPGQVHQVFDPLNPTAICPACGVEFQTSATECPDFGLVFGRALMILMVYDLNGLDRVWVIGEN